MNIILMNNEYIVMNNSRYFDNTNFLKLIFKDKTDVYPRSQNIKI